MSNLYCIIPMQTLESTFGLVFNQYIQVRASAYNAYGWSTVSASVATQTLRRKPEKMNTPVRHADTSTTLLVLEWTAFTSVSDTGNSEITSYDV